MRDWMDQSGEASDPLYQNFKPSKSFISNLAEWIVSDNNPLTARVFVNRLWKMFLNRYLWRT